MKSQPQYPEFRNNPENSLPCFVVLSKKKMASFVCNSTVVKLTTFMPI